MMVGRSLLAPERLAREGRELLEIVLVACRESLPRLVNLLAQFGLYLFLHLIPKSRVSTFEAGHPVLDGGRPTARDAWGSELHAGAETGDEDHLRAMLEVSETLESVAEAHDDSDHAADLEDPTDDDQKCSHGYDASRRISAPTTWIASQASPRVASPEG
jgi:hypothetical protein